MARPAQADSNQVSSTGFPADLPPAALAGGLGKAAAALGLDADTLAALGLSDVGSQDANPLQDLLNMSHPVLPALVMQEQEVPLQMTEARRGRRKWRLWTQRWTPPPTTAATTDPRSSASSQGYPQTSSQLSQSPTSPRGQTEYNQSIWLRHGVAFRAGDVLVVKGKLRNLGKQDTHRKSARIDFAKGDKCAWRRESDQAWIHNFQFAVHIRPNEVPRLPSSALPRTLRV